jgi:hypothetical protein
LDSHPRHFGETPGLSDFAGGFFEEFVDKGLVGFGLFGGHAAELAEKFWGDTDGDELFRVAGGGAADSASAAEFGWGRFGDVRSRIKSRAVPVPVTTTSHFRDPS